MLTAINFSKLYYEANVWHILGLERNPHKMINYASANALRVCVPSWNVFTTHSALHALAKRALPINTCL